MPDVLIGRVKLLAVPLHHLEIPERVPSWKLETSSFEHLNDRAIRRTHVLEEILSYSEGNRFR